MRTVQNRLRQWVTSHRGESGAGMIVALMLLLILLGLSTFMLYLSMKSLEKGTSVQNFSAAGNATEAAIANMMTLANSEANKDGSEIEKHIGSTNAARGTYQANEVSPSGDGLYSWEWYAEPRSDMEPGTGYNVYASGYRKEANEPEARSIRILLTSSTVEGVFYDAEGLVNHDVALGGVSSYAAFGNTALTMQGTAQANTYNSRTTVGRPLASEGTAAVATNGKMTLGGSASQAALIFHGRPSGEMTSAICSGSPCTAGTVSTYRHKVSMRHLTNKGLSACPLSNYPDWVASAQNGAISSSATPQCYNNIVFDDDTKLSGDVSTGNPAILYAKGNVTVEPGVEVASQIQRAQGPQALQIVGLSGGTFQLMRSSATDPTRFTGTFMGQNMNCDIGSGSSPSNHDTLMMGSLACNNVTIRSDSVLWWDKQGYNAVAEGSETSKKIWAPQIFEEQ